MPSVSKAQRRFMGMCEHADHPPGRCPSMTKEQFHDFASTSEKDLPDKAEKTNFRMTKKNEKDLTNGFRSKE